MAFTWFPSAFPLTLGMIAPMTLPNSFIDEAPVCVIAS